MKAKTCDAIGGDSRLEDGSGPRAWDALEDWTCEFDQWWKDIPEYDNHNLLRLGLRDEGEAGRLMVGVARFLKE